MMCAWTTGATWRSRPQTSWRSTPGSSLMVARSPSLWLVPQSRHRVYIEYPPNPLTLSSQAKVVGLAQSVQYNGLRGCIAGHAKPGSVYIEYPPSPLTLSSQAKVVGPKTESRSNPKAKSRSLTKPGLSKMREPSYCARGPNTGCS